MKYIITPVLYGLVYPWYEDIILFFSNKEKCNFVKINILDLCFECSRHKELLSLFDEKEIEALEGEPIAAALTAAGIKVFHRSPKKEEPRG